MSEPELDTSVEDEDEDEDEGAEEAPDEPEAAAPVVPPPPAAEQESVPCPLCAGVGALPVAPLQDPERTRCRICDGWGQVLTGSRVGESAIDMCSHCAGRGWVSVEPTSQQPMVTSAYGLSASGNY